ncbi:cut-like homeobox 1b isoform X2 [Osmerus eperlanus]|uniref:cut-like homeobox 1b isoform X2 n=1 Tax=Osmerus eperlanus TaxID=29151 RepID=UPI002E0F1DB4
MCVFMHVYVHTCVRRYVSMCICVCVYICMRVCVVLRPLCRAAAGVLGGGALWCGAETADTEAGAGPEHRPIPGLLRPSGHPIPGLLRPAGRRGLRPQLLHPRARQGGPQGQMDSLLSIISSQRERFRTRNQELEAEGRSMQQTMLALQTELDSMRADNIKLYEKIKFLQGYPGRGGGNDDTVMRYSSQYEERLDPFTSFSKRERQRRYLSLSPWDKATLSLGRGILSNKMARTIAFFYTLFLHCLVFLVLYKTAWSESIGRDCNAFCAKKYSDHLHRFHENGDNGDMWQ